MLTPAWATFSFPHNGRAWSLQCFDSRAVAELLFVPSHLDAASHWISAKTRFLLIFNTFSIKWWRKNRINTMKVLLVGNSESFLTREHRDLCCYAKQPLTLLSKLSCQSSSVTPCCAPGRSLFSLSFIWGKHWVRCPLWGCTTSGDSLPVSVCRRDFRFKL